MIYMLVLILWVLCVAGLVACALAWRDHDRERRTLVDLHTELREQLARLTKEFDAREEAHRAEIADLEEKVRAVLRRAMDVVLDARRAPGDNLELVATVTLDPSLMALYGGQGRGESFDSSLRDWVIFQLGQLFESQLKAMDARCGDLIRAALDRVAEKMESEGACCVPRKTPECRRRGGQ